eukprot:TRINITY_DN60214_c0_g1_i1.p1 TRINITY_DN60214_c0_g1~~TRINITY_DN60214_c0_g1_i1.p1  ORF type:complete len:157 (-),score=6.17 TRINITY_DN60214_c0_g1_i1:68-538(-)
MVPPRLRVVTPIYHPNVDRLGRFICLDVLDFRWSPAVSLTRLLQTVQVSLGDPVGSMAETVPPALAHGLWEADRVKAADMARRWTVAFACPCRSWRRDQHDLYPRPFRSVVRCFASLAVAFSLPPPVVELLLGWLDPLCPLVPAWCSTPLPPFTSS